MVTYCFSPSEDPVISSHFCEYPFWTMVAEFGIVLLYNKVGNRVLWVHDYVMYCTVTQVGGLALSSSYTDECSCFIHLG